MSNEPSSIPLKLLFMGDMGVGKSSLILRYTDDQFMFTYVSTIGVDFKVKTIMADGLPVRLQICDTAGQERFRTITSSYYRQAQGLIFVYDVNDLSTFSGVENWIKESIPHTDSNVARILVGNKNENPELKTVATKDAELLAANYSCLFIETSAKDGENVNQMFDMITRAALQRRQLNKQQLGELKLHPLPVLHSNPKRKCCS